MINSLREMLTDKFLGQKIGSAPKKDMQEQSDDELMDTVVVLRSENIELRELYNNSQKMLDIALDEIVLNRKRIKSLLKQLEEKSGGML